MIYVVNRLRINYRYTNRVILSSVSDHDEGRRVGLTVEERGEPHSRWVFVGMFESNMRVGEGGDWREEDLLTFGIDVRELGGVSEDTRG